MEDYAKIAKDHLKSYYALQRRMVVLSKQGRYRELLELEDQAMWHLNKAHDAERDSHNITFHGYDETHNKVS